MWGLPTESRKATKSRLRIRTVSGASLVTSLQAATGYQKFIYMG
jgi:hypothetical protein